MTQQNAALVEESAAAAESLKDQSRQLATAVASFKLGNGTGRRRAAAKAVAPMPARASSGPSRSGEKLACQAPGTPAANRKSGLPPRQAPSRTQASCAAKQRRPPPAAPVPASSSGASDEWESF
jgi:methyl-accepting chemotaxis protein